MPNTDSAPVQTTDVAIVGAGPTGLMLALCLAKQGVRSVVVDAKSGPTRESRAIVLQARTMEILDQLGLVDAVLTEATVTDTFRPGFEKHSYARVDLRRLGRGLTPYPHLYVLEQSATERILGDALAATGQHVLWQHPFESLERAETGTHLAVRAPDGGLRTIAARYCVGADGSASPVRKSMGIPFEGSTNAHEFFVVDAIGVAGLALDSVNVRLGRHDFLLSFPMGSVDHERLIGTIRPEQGVELTEQRVREQLERTFGVSYSESRWYSTYRVHHRVAQNFRSGPVFLAGDAAHVHSPVGAQGMNTGLQDSHNLAAALTDVIRGAASDDRLDRYEAERRPVARRLISTTDSLFGFATSERRMPTLARQAFVRFLAPFIAIVVPRSRRASRLFGYLSQTRIHYRMPDEPHGRRDEVVGRRLAWNGDNFDSLRSLKWQVHSYGEVPEASPAEIAATLDLPLHRHPILRNDLFQPGMLYLVRPDGFVAATAPPQSVHTLYESVPRKISSSR